MTCTVSPDLMPLTQDIYEFAESMKGCRLEIFGDGGYVAARSEIITDVSVTGRRVIFKIPRIKNVEVREGTRYSFFRLITGTLVFVGTVGDDLVLGDYWVSDKPLCVAHFEIGLPEAPEGFYESLAGDFPTR